MTTKTGTETEKLTPRQALFALMLSVPDAEVAAQHVVVSFEGLNEHWYQSLLHELGWCIKQQAALPPNPKHLKVLATMAAVPKEEKWQAERHAIIGEYIRKTLLVYADAIILANSEGKLEESLSGLLTAIIQWMELYCGLKILGARQFMMEFARYFVCRSLWSNLPLADAVLRSLSAFLLPSETTDTAEEAILRGLGVNALGSAVMAETNGLQGVATALRAFAHSNGWVDTDVRTSAVATAKHGQAIGLRLLDTCRSHRLGLTCGNPELDEAQKALITELAGSLQRDRDSAEGDALQTLYDQSDSLLPNKLLNARYRRGPFLGSLPQRSLLHRHVICLLANGQWQRAFMVVQELFGTVFHERFLLGGLPHAHPRGRLTEENAHSSILYLVVPAMVLAEKLGNLAIAAALGQLLLFESLYGNNAPIKDVAHARAWECVDAHITACRKAMQETAVSDEKYPVLREQCLAAMSNRDDALNTRMRANEKSILDTAASLQEALLRDETLTPVVVTWYHNERRPTSRT